MLRMLRWLRKGGTPLDSVVVLQPPFLGPYLLSYHRVGLVLTAG